MASPTGPERPPSSPASRGKAFLPLLVAGVPGVPGFNAFLRFRARFPGQVFGIAPAHLPALRAPGGPYGPGLLAADPEDPEDLDRLFRAHGFRGVIDASGWCALRPCEHDPARARRLNVDAGVNLMRVARRHGARLVRLSTDLVFDGRPRRSGGVLRLGGYREDEPVSPVTVYGKLMAEAEAAIAAGYPEAAILRTALPMGPSLNGHAGAVDWIVGRFRKGRPATLYLDEVRSNLYVQDLNRALEAFLGNGAPGLWHVGGPRPMSLFRIGQAVNRLGDFPPELLMGCLRAEAGPVPPRAGDVTLDSSRAEALLPPETLGPWPRVDHHVPGGAEWHLRDAGDVRGADAGEDLGRYLYGYWWPGAWDHPLNLLPVAPRVAGWEPSSRHAAGNRAV